MARWFPVRRSRKGGWIVAEVVAAMVCASLLSCCISLDARGFLGIAKSNGKNLRDTVSIKTRGFRQLHHQSAVNSPLRWKRCKHQSQSGRHTLASILSESHHSRKSTPVDGVGSPLISSMGTNNPLQAVRRAASFITGRGVVGDVGASTTGTSNSRDPEILVDLGGASLTVHYFDGTGNQRSVMKSKLMLANSSCSECIELRKEGLERGLIKERTPPDYAELGYTFVDYSDSSAYPWEEVSSYLARVIRSACRQISEVNPLAATARLTVLQTGKIREIGGPEWEDLMRAQLQAAFGAATFVDFPAPPQHALLSSSDEAYFEGLMMFKYQDLSMIDINLPFAGPTLERDNALALSIGSSSTQMYTLDNRDGSLISRTNTRLGVYPPDFSPTNSLVRFKTGGEFAIDFHRLLFDDSMTKGKQFLLLVNAIGYVMKEIPSLAVQIKRQEPISKDVFCRESKKWLRSMTSYKHRRWDLDLELYHQLQLLSGLVQSLEKDKHIEYIIVEKKGHLKPNGLHMMDEKKLDYHWVTAVHKYGLSSAAAKKSSQGSSSSSRIFPILPG
mmetsp:Transcript_29620/g.47490  ORF Transcript_29620/g.47490 Transcript_29620/m.47490 type:complete len:559 (+) Transcript_29620:116-1792(+)